MREDPSIVLLEASSRRPLVARVIRDLRADRPGPAFFILDSRSHQGPCTGGTRPGTNSCRQWGLRRWYEDGNINGNPVLPGWGEGPSEALQEYFRRYPEDYTRDTQREKKFGFTFAPSGYLVKA
ncbi:MAG: CmcI family methyltransferase [Halioglobus sp.]|nr:CmcI family methyltransferase [Halioglobus sp.]